MKPSYFVEIFGLDEIAPPIYSKPVPTLPMDNELHDFSKATRTAEIDRLQDSHVSELLIGDLMDASGEVFTPSAQKIINRKAADSRSSWQLGTPRIRCVCRLD
jgi:hypothetical protein